MHVAVLQLYWGCTGPCARLVGSPCLTLLKNAVFLPTVWDRCIMNAPYESKIMRVGDPNKTRKKKEGRKN